MKNIKTSKEMVENFSQYLNSIFKIKNGLNFSSLFEKWEMIIGNKNLALKCELEDIKNNCLVICTTHTGWSQQIMLQKKQILKNINKMYPELKIENISVIIKE